MPKANTIQTNFTAGEISPQLKGRVDLNRYQNGADKLLNMIVRPQGGATRRMGTRFVSSTKDSSKKSIVVEFIFSNIQAYILEFGHLYIRFYKNGGQILGGDDSPLEVVTPYMEADLDLLSFAQSADFLYIAHPSYQPKTLTRSSDTVWAFSGFVPLDGPYLDADSSDTVFTLKNYSDTGVLTGAAAGTFSGLPATSTGYAVSLTLSAAFPTTAGLTFTGVFTATGTSVTGGRIVFSDGSSMTITGTITGIPTGTRVSNFSGRNVLLSDGVTVQPQSLGIVNGAGSLQDGSISIAGSSTTTLGGTISIPGTGKFVEYKKDNQWLIAEISSAIGDGSSANVIFHPNIIQGIDAHAKLTLNVANTVSSLSQVFQYTDVGNYIRLTNGTWRLTTAFNSDSSMVSSAVSMVDLEPPYPSTIITQQSRTIQGTLNADTASFVATDVGRLVRLNFGGQQQWGTITTFTDTKNVIVTFDGPVYVDTTDKTQLYNHGVPTEIRFGAWSNTTGWPSFVTFHEQRLTFASSPKQPATTWMSQSGDYPNFAPTEPDSKVIDSDAVTFTIVSSKVSVITWIRSGPVLLIGTTGGEWQVKPNTLNEALTPSNVTATPQTEFGSKAGFKAHRIGSAVLFVERSGRKIREMTYNFQLDQFEAKDLTIISEHILRKGGLVHRSTYQQIPNSLYWVALNDGTLACMTYERDNEVVSWHSHVLGANNTAAVVESLAVIPSSDGTADYLYMVVKRTINGVQKRYIEYMELDFEPTSSSDLSYYLLDCGLSYNGDPVGTVSGLDHLEGEVVDVVADGNYLGTRTVLDGGVILGVNASIVHVGYKYTSTLGILPLDGGATMGTSQGNMKRVHRLVLRLLNSAGFKHGPTESKLTIFNDCPGVWASTKGLLTKDARCQMDQSYTLSGQFVVVQTDPYPLTILAVMPEFTTNE